ncbi:MAG: tRNA-dihydrouridine synthase, partial [Desulfamplus sp.]|nr:tRNA-dihydrouridine synthase [Desulfamplus sp.]
TIKIRSGWDSSGIQAFRLAESAQKCGVDAIAFHPRTALQGFRGKADWSLIEKLKANISIPLIGNGDIVSAADGVRMMQQTGCDAVMVGRAAMSNPFILSDIESLINKEIPISDKYDKDRSLDKDRLHDKVRSIDEIFSIMKELLSSSVDYFGEKPACKIMRSRLVWFVKGLPGCSSFRQQMTNIESMPQAIDLIDEYQNSVETQGSASLLLNIKS